MLVVYLWLIPHAGIAYLIPVFATAALVFGTVNGLIAAHFMDNDEMLNIASLENTNGSPQES